MFANSKKDIFVDLKIFFGHIKSNLEPSSSSQVVPSLINALVKIHLLKVSPKLANKLRYREIMRHFVTIMTKFVDI